MAQLLKEFLKAKRSLFAVYMITIGVFSLIFIFGRMPLNLLLYSTELTFFLFLVFQLTSLYHYSKKRRILHALNRENVSLLEQLPTSTDPLEKVYKENIQSLGDQLRESEKQANERYTEQLDYFTLWLHQVKTPIAAIGLLVQSNQKIQS